MLSHEAASRIIGAPPDAVYELKAWFSLSEAMKRRARFRHTVVMLADGSWSRIPLPYSLLKSAATARPKFPSAVCRWMPERQNPIRRPGKRR